MRRDKPQQTSSRAQDALTDERLDERARMGFGKGHVFCTISEGTTGGHWADDGQALEPGRPVSTEYVRQLVRRMAGRAGIESRVTPHTLRDTFATRLLRTTGNLELRRKALRRSHIQTTVAAYAQLVPEGMDRGGRHPTANETAEPRNGNADLTRQIAARRVQRGVPQMATASRQACPVRYSHSQDVLSST